MVREWVPPLVAELTAGSATGTASFLLRCFLVPLRILAAVAGRLAPRVAVSYQLYTGFVLLESTWGSYASLASTKAADLPG